MITGFRCRDGEARSARSQANTKRPARQCPPRAMNNICRDRGEGHFDRATLDRLRLVAQQIPSVDISFIARFGRAKWVGGIS